MPAQPSIAFFKDLDKNDGNLVGGKGANLGEMASIKLPVPDGFAVTVGGYKKFLTENSLEKEIYSLLEKTDVNKAEELMEVSRKIQKIIKSSPVPQEVVLDIRKAYKKLSGVFTKALVAVRSSATAEDMPGTSFAGQQATFLNIKGENSLVDAVRECWASLFTARSIFYRVQNKIPHKKVLIAVIVQKMIQSEVSGVMFTINPVTNEKDRIVIEAVWGLGEMIVQGSVIPDRFVVQKETNALLSKEISTQTVQLIKVGEDTKEAQVPKSKIDIQKITDSEVKTLARYGEKIQDHYYFPQDIEWAKDAKGNLFIIQTRPVTTLGTVKAMEAKLAGGEDIKITTTPILTGLAASPGVGNGIVRIVKSPKEIAKVSQGDVLVAPMTSPDYVPAMKKAAAIVTDQGGQTSHAAIVSRELGVPCIVGTKEATALLKEGAIVTVDGSRGQVFMGSKVKIEKTEEKEKAYKGHTATRVYVNLAEPQRVAEIAKLNVDGVGLLRAEFMIADIGIHPKEAIKQKKQDVFVNKLAHDLTTFCKAFDPRPVVYRATDFKTNEYRALPGGKAWEPEEPNPMLGFRGAYRYNASPEVFNLELSAIKRVRENYKNLWLMIPFVRSPEELAKVRRIVASEGLFASPTFKFWMMVEIPTNVIRLEDFIKVGIDGVSIGSNDLTMLLMGTDRDNGEVADVFNERDPAVSWALRRTIKICNKHNVSSSICGQAPSVYDDLVEDLVRWGVTSMSVNPDAVNRVRRVVAEAEKKVVS